MTVMSYTMYKSEILLKKVTNKQNWPRSSSFHKSLWSIVGWHIPERRKKKKQKQSVSEQIFKTPLPLSTDGFASCVRSSANTEPDSQTSRSPGPGNRWMGQENTKWWWWCWRKRRRHENLWIYNMQHFSLKIRKKSVSTPNS